MFFHGAFLSIWTITPLLAKVLLAYIIVKQPNDIFISWNKGTLLQTAWVGGQVCPCNIYLTALHTHTYTADQNPYPNPYPYPQSPQPSHQSPLPSLSSCFPSPCKLINLISVFVCDMLKHLFSAIWDVFIIYFPDLLMFCDRAWSPGKRWQKSEKGYIHLRGTSIQEEKDRHCRCDGTWVQPCQIQVSVA